ncbi:YbaB/EbfC family nucleoid-associated protein [Mycobacterium sp.]|uniref:YbaB/EbfC family nucleoid-associated protein n=1 Tax=Mycobacterium sp. TaxID=1785 RepID=UPI002D9937A8|nr:YbaB/EbfC family nucleoid-associated protein [Mycobacterium sp.]
MTEVLALVQEQMADIAAVQRRQAELTASAATADGLVEVTVNAHGHVIKTVIDEAYLDEFEFEELSDHITEAAQTAVRTAATRVAEMMASITERRQALPAFSEIVDGAPDLRDLVPPALESLVVAAPSADPDDNDGTDESAFPTVRR